MKRLSEQEFRALLEQHPNAKAIRRYTDEEINDRERAIQRARHIFIKSGLTDNITVAFQLYQDIFGEREREIFVTAASYGRYDRHFMDKYVRPTCPECGTDMKFRVVPKNNENIKTQLVCPNEDCDTVLDSKLTLAEWMGVLEKK